MIDLRFVWAGESLSFLECFAINVDFSTGREGVEKETNVWIHDLNLRTTGHSESTVWLISLQVLVVTRYKCS